MRNIEVISAEVTSDEGSYCFSFSASILRSDDFNHLKPGEDATLLFNDIVYKVIVDERSRSQSFGNKAYSISGRSITARLGEGWSDPITKVWEAENASSIIQELCQEVGITSEYLATDWLIPKGVLSSNAEYRINVIQKIAEAVGAIVQSKPDGTLVILPKYKVSPVHIDTTAPDLVIASPSDVLSLSESYDVNPKYNEVVVMNMADTDDIYSIEIIENIDIFGRCKIAVYVYPFKETLQLFTSSDSVNIVYQGVKQLAFYDEIIEIVNGSGSSSKVIKNLIGTPVYITNDLGIISYNASNIKTQEMGQSLIKISYFTEYHEFNVSTLDVDNPFQIYTVEE